MQAYVIYVHGSPLEWQLDRHTRQVIGRDCPLFYGFLDQSDGERVLREVPQLFDLNDEDALGLQINAIEIPSGLTDD